MISRSLLRLLFVCVVVAGCHSSKQSTGNGRGSLYAKDLLPIGRTDLVHDRLELISSAVHFGFSFEGEACEIYASLPEWLDHNYLQYELDGVYQKRIRISQADKGPVRLTAKGSGKHEVWIYKATEATTGAVFIEKVNGEHVRAIASPEAPLIEFIGNSITCGAAADASEVPCGSGVYHDQHNAYYAYGPRVARALGVNYIMSSVSGIGIYRTWNREEPSMPVVYDRTDFQAGSARQWNFSKYRPKIVSIALGTNDLSNGDGKTPRTPFDSARFVNNYVQFVAFVKTQYPAAQIAFLNSPMVGGERNVLLENCLKTIKLKIDAMHPLDKAVALFFFKPMHARGCGGHPSVEDHAILADELMPFFKNLLDQQ